MNLVWRYCLSFGNICKFVELETILLRIWTNGPSQLVNRLISKEKQAFVFVDENFDCNCLKIRSDCCDNCSLVGMRSADISISGVSQLFVS